MKHNANLNVKGVVLASSASISSANVIHAVSGSNTMATSGTLVLSNSWLTFGLDGNTITATAVGGRYASFWPLSGEGMSTFNLNTGLATTDVTGTTESVQFNVYPVIFSMSQYYTAILGGMYWGSTANATGSATERMFYGVYSKTGSTLSADSDKTWIFNIHHSQNGTNSFTVRWWWGTNSTQNFTTVDSPANVTNEVMWASVGTTTGATLTPGQWFFARGYSKSTSGAAPINGLSSGLVYGASNSANPRTDYGVSSGNITVGLNQFMGHVAITTTGTQTANFLMPLSFATSLISVSAAGQWQAAVIMLRG